jgi:glycosyltransferase involved in cell wall biosynthesis
MDLTVLLTVHNGLPYLGQAVESVLAQTPPDFTFLILDNGSNDGGEIWLDGLRDPRLRLIRLPGVLPRTEALNRGLSLITTAYTAIIDADELAEPGRLAAQTDFLAAHPEVDLLGCSVTVIDPQGEILGRRDFPWEHKALVAHLPLFNPFAHAACAFRTRAVLEAGGYPEDFPYAQDEALWITLLRRGCRVASLPAPLARIRVHPAQASRDEGQRRVRARDNYRLALAMTDIPGLPPTSRQAARLRAAGALCSLGRRREALAQARLAVAEAPLLLLVNPLLWRRLLLGFGRRLGKRL